MFPHPPGAGGPGSFQVRFQNQLKAQGDAILYKGDKAKPDLIFVVGGTKRLFWLLKMKLKGIPIIYRLDGIGWLHKRTKVNLKYYCTAELRNASSKAIHAFLATKIVYQSQFVKDWWDKSGWRVRKNTTIIHNGVSIPNKKIIKNTLRGNSIKRLVVLEGVIDYTPYALRLLNELATTLADDIQIEIYGKFGDENTRNKLHQRLDYKGFVKREDVYNVLMGSVYLSLDINPACPNTVAEALACGAPVIAFNTGSLPELVDITCGKVVPYGSNPWDLEYPDVKSLMQGIIEVFNDYNRYSNAAFIKANDNYSLQMMFEKYKASIQETLLSST
jgi:glycosyltransferase involved in cell wall biosynthesis